jgi:hypothetical protein
VYEGQIRKVGLPNVRHLTEVTETRRKLDTCKSLILRAGDRDRTGDVQLGKLNRD